MKSSLTLVLAAPDLDSSVDAPKPMVMKVGSDSLNMQFVDPFSPRNGRITEYSVVVTSDPQDPDISRRGLLNTYRVAKNDNKPSWLVSASCVCEVWKFLAILADRFDFQDEVRS